MNVLRPTLLMLAVCLAQPAPAASDLPALGDASSAIISPEQEHQLGRAWLSVLRGQVAQLTDPQLEGFRRAQRLPSGGNQPVAGPAPGIRAARQPAAQRLRRARRDHRRQRRAVPACADRGRIRLGARPRTGPPVATPLRPRPGSPAAHAVADDGRAARRGDRSRLRCRRRGNRRHRLDPGRRHPDRSAASRGRTSRKPTASA